MKIRIVVCQNKNEKRTAIAKKFVRRGGKLGVILLFLSE